MIISGYIWKRNLSVTNGTSVLTICPVRNAPFCLQHKKYGRYWQYVKLFSILLHPKIFQQMHSSQVPLHKEIISTLRTGQLSNETRPHSNKQISYPNLMYAVNKIIIFYGCWSRSLRKILLFLNRGLYNCLRQRRSCKSCALRTGQI